MPYIIRCRFVLIVRNKWQVRAENELLSQHQLNENRILCLKIKKNKSEAFVISEESGTFARRLLSGRPLTCRFHSLIVAPDFIGQDAMVR